MGASRAEQALYELARRWLAELAADAARRAASSSNPDWVRRRDTFAAELRTLRVDDAEGVDRVLTEYQMAYSALVDAR